jgi:hypothetical protein
MTRITAPDHTSETLNGGIRDLRGPSGYQTDTLLVRGYFAAGRVSTVGDDGAEVEWIAPAAPPSILPLQLFLTRSEPGDLFKLGGGPLRQPQSPHWE